MLVTFERCFKIEVHVLLIYFIHKWLHCTFVYLIHVHISWINGEIYPESYEFVPHLKLLQPCYVAYWMSCFIFYARLKLSQNFYFRSDSSGQEAYLYQLFVEKDEKIILPTTQQLLGLSFLQSKIKLAEVRQQLIRTKVLILNFVWRILIG